MAFAGYPSAIVYGVPGSGNRRDAVQHLIWGDWLKPLGPVEDEWVEVQARGEHGWMRRSDIQEERLLEVNFVDVGQGDGCFIVTPADRFLIVDAGEGDNMYRFLRWRFGRFEQEITFEAAVITHPDQDHYRGFKPLVDEPKVRFGTFFHNGIVERAGSDPLGPRVMIGKERYLADVIIDRAGLDAIIGDPQKLDNKEYALLLKTAAENGRTGDIRMLCAEDGFLPGYSADQTLSMRVLGPVPEKGAAGQRLLRWFGSRGETKNGHSIVIQVRYGVVTLLLGGDLNAPSEGHLLAHYTGLDPEPKTAVDEEMLVNAAREAFQADIAKACHHGSADFTDLYLQAVNPVATIVSSGDDEPYSHPRPDALGALGKYGRGRRPLIFSTELARSAQENIKHPHVLRKRIAELSDALDRAETEAQKAGIRRQLEKETSGLERSIAVYGMISLRTDGEKVIIAQKLERPRSKADKWDIHRLESGPGRRLRSAGD